MTCTDSSTKKPGYDSDIILSGLTGLNDEDAIKRFHAIFNEEIEYLKYAYATPEAGTGAGLVSEEPTPSRLLYGQDYVEVNRSLVGMLALKWVLANDYSAFTRYQPPAVKLTPESFAEFRALCIDCLPTPEDTLTLLAAIVINDLGKSSRFVEDIEAVTGSQMGDSNHDVVVYTAAQKNMIPCLRNLGSSHREDILLGLQLSAGLNIAQLAQAENVPGSLKTAAIMNGHTRAFNLKFLETLFDVAGASANREARCAKQMVEPVFQSYMMTRDIIMNVIEGRGSLRENYDQLLAKHGRNLETRGFRRLVVSVPSERALLRLLMMGRSTNNAEQAGLFEAAFEALPPKDKQALVNGLNVDGVDDGEAIIPYYMPALIAEGLRNTTDSATLKIKALSSLMRFLGRVYGNPKDVRGTHGSVVEHNLMYVMEVVHGQAFKVDPEVLDKVQVDTNEGLP